MRCPLFFGANFFCVFDRITNSAYAAFGALLNHKKITPTSAKTATTLANFCIMFIFKLMFLPP